MEETTGGILKQLFRLSFLCVRPDFSLWDSPLLRRGCVCFLRWHLGPSAMIFALCLNAALRTEPPLPPRLPPPHNRPLSAPGLRHFALRHNLFML